MLNLYALYRQGDGSSVWLWGGALFSCVNSCEDGATRRFNPCEDSVFVILHASASSSAGSLDGSRARPNLWVFLAACYAIHGACGTRNIVFRRMCAAPCHPWHRGISPSMDKSCGALRGREPSALALARLH